MQFTNTLNNHPKNKRKKNYYHTDTPPLPIIVQHFIKDTDDSFLNTIKQINHEFNQNKKYVEQHKDSATIQKIVDVLHSHLHDETNKEFLKSENHQNKIVPKNPDYYQNIIKQNKNVKTLKDTILNVEDENFQLFQVKAYLELINQSHLFDSKITEQIQNLSAEIIQDYYVIQQQNEPRLKQLRHKLKPSPLKIAKEKGYDLFNDDSEKFIHLKNIINHDYDLSNIVNIIQEDINKKEKSTHYWIRNYTGNNLMFKLIEKQFKTNQLINLLLNNKLLIDSDEFTLISKTIQHNPELLISKINNQSINPVFNEILNNPDFGTTLKNIEHYLKRKQYNHLTKTQLTKLNYLINQLNKNDNQREHTSDFNILYKLFFGAKRYATLFLNKIDDFTISKNDFDYNIQEANEKIINIIKTHKENFGNYNDDDFENDENSYYELIDYQESLKVIERAIKQITKQPYRFYETFYNKLTDPLKILTIDEKQYIDAYITTKEIKHLQTIIKYQQDSINHTKDPISNLNLTKLALNIVLKNNNAQKQNFKYSNNDHSTPTYDNVYYKKTEYNQALKQIIQHSINPQQQLRLPKDKSEGTKVNQYHQIIQESLSQHKNQYAKQLINEFKQINKKYKYMPYSYYNSLNNRLEMDTKYEQLETIMKHHSNNASMNQLKENYLSSIFNEQENGLNSKSHILNNLILLNFYLGRNVLNTILHRYPKSFNLVEPIVDAD